MHVYYNDTYLDLVYIGYIFAPSDGKKADRGASAIRACGGDNDIRSCHGAYGIGKYPAHGGRDTCVHSRYSGSHNVVSVS